MGNCKKALVVGCGYVGLHLGMRLNQLGFKVTGTAHGHKRISQLQHVGIEPLPIWHWQPTCSMNSV
jgi:UDP-glucose 6-dehydrogenase